MTQPSTLNSDDAEVASFVVHPNPQSFPVRKLFILPGRLIKVPLLSARISRALHYPGLSFSIASCRATDSDESWRIRAAAAAATAVSSPEMHTLSHVVHRVLFIPTPATLVVVMATFHGDAARLFESNRNCITLFFF
jgi:hypothetical protein